jgi:signal transduction histidine kinase
VSLKAQEGGMHVSTSKTPAEFAKDTSRLSALIIKAKTYRHKAVDSGLRAYQQILIESKKIGYTDGVARSLIGMGLLYMDKGEYNKSLKLYELARPYCEKSTFGGGILIAGLYNNIAALYGNRGVFDTATIYYSKSLAEMERRQIRDTNLLLLIYSNLGARLVKDSMLDQGQFYLEKGEILAERTNNDPMLAKIYTDLAAMYGLRKQYDKARIYASSALDLFKKKKDPASAISANCIIARCYREEGKLQKAIAYYEEAFSDSANTSPAQLEPAYRGLGKCYYQLKNRSKAKGYYFQALKIAQHSRINRGMMDSYSALMDIYNDEGDYKTAWKYRNAYDQLKDSTINAEKIKLVAQLNIIYRTSEKDKELVEKRRLIENKESEIKRKNTLIASIGGGSFLVVALLGSMYRNRQHRERLRTIKAEKEREVAQLKATLKGEEKERVRIARELHDGIMVQFSSVQMNLSALIEKSGNEHPEDYEHIQAQLEEATKELRKSAHNLMPDMLLQEGLAEATHYFCNNLQRSAKMEIDFQWYGETPALSPEYELMIYRIIQELLQNTVKHARATYALVQINCQPDMITIAVEDNGRGFDRNNLPPDKGMGLTSLENRIHSLHGHFTITSKPATGTSVYIEMETQYLQQTDTENYAYNGSHN